jgi:hypothetical protein
MGVSLPTIDKRIARRDSEVRLMNLLQERLARLLAPASEGGREAKPVGTVEEAIVEVAQKVNRPGWCAYLVGGTLRDLLTGFESGRGGVEPRDVDIIVEGATSEELQELVRPTLQLERLTRFGGLHLSRPLPSGSRVLFDLWTLRDTWGFQSKKIPPRIEDFPGTTFLNIDSCAIELQQTEGRERRLFEGGFFASIADRVLDVNYEPNPYPYVCAARSLVLAARLDFTLTRRLAGYILGHAAVGGVEALIEAQRSHYGMVRSGAEELGKWIEEIRLQMEKGEPAIGIQVSRARRLVLWNDYPAAGSEPIPA